MITSLSAGPTPCTTGSAAQVSRPGAHTPRHPARSPRATAEPGGTTSQAAGCGRPACPHPPEAPGAQGVVSLLFHDTFHVKSALCSVPLSHHGSRAPGDRFAEGDFAREGRVAGGESVERRRGEKSRPPGAPRRLPWVWGGHPEFRRHKGWLWPGLLPLRGDVTGAQRWPSADRLWPGEGSAGR